MANEKIMIIDDDVEFLEELEETLRLSGYDPVSVNDSTNAVAFANKIRPHVILLDIRMGKLNGFQVAERLREIEATKEIPIIAMTAYFAEEEHNDIMKMCGMYACLKKPLNPLDVIHHIEKVLQKTDAPSANNM